MKKEEFYTARGYAINSENNITESMEDYIEMIYRLSMKAGYTRVSDLSISLNVQMPSITKMLKKLSNLNIVYYKRYGSITLTNYGKEIGQKLFIRHENIMRFLKTLGVKENLLKDTEKMEHSISLETYSCILKFLEFIEGNKEIKNQYYKFTE